MAENDNTTTACPMKSSCCGFCYKNLWHWIVLVAALPYIVNGVKFVMNFVTSSTLAN